VAEKSPKSEANDSEILRIAKERYQTADKYWSPIYKLGEEDLEFVSGDQWHPIDRQNREQDNRPILTVNKLPQHLNQVVNDQRQNRPAIKVSPVDDNADIETAKTIQGLIRNIQNDSNADAARDRAFEGAAGNGFGFYRIITKYVSPYSFDQKLQIARIADPFTVRIDPFSREPDGSDMKYGFVETFYSKDDYCAEFGESKLAEHADWNESHLTSDGWVKDETARVCEYYTLDYDEITIVQYRNQNGEIFVQEQSQIPEGVVFEVLKTRKSKIPKVMHYKLNGLEILERTTFPGIYIPIIPVYGKEMIVKGKRILESLIRHSKDSQRMYNYMTTSEAELIGLAPKAPWIVAEGQIPDEYESAWATANTKSHSKLVYKPTSHAGQPVPPPMRNVYNVPTQAITSSRMQSSDDIKATTGIYDAALGAQAREVSGRAIERRNAQSQTSNYHFIDNLTRSIKHEGRILVGAIPYVYDAERCERILGEEGDEQVVKLNAPHVQENGEQVLYDLSVGEYDVNVETGPNFATKRQEAAAAMMDFTKALPQQAAVISDLVVKNMDWPGASELAERLKKTLPPGFAEDKNKKPQEIPPEVQQKMEQMGQLVDQLTQKLQEQSEIVKNKTLEIESKERIAFAEIQADLTKAELKYKAEAALVTLNAEIQDAQKRLELLRINEPIENQNQNLDPSFSEPSSDQVMVQNQQQLTGESSPGTSMGV
jgi:hypothetical protein